MVIDLGVLTERVTNLGDKIDDMRDENREAHTSIQECINGHTERIGKIERFQERLRERARNTTGILAVLQVIGSSIAAWIGTKK
jgi:hypothetical protein